MTEPNAALNPSGAVKPARKRGPRPSADLGDIVRAVSEFRAYVTAIPGDKHFAVSIVDRGSPDLVRLAEACANLTPDQRTLARVMCMGLIKED